MSDAMCYVASGERKAAMKTPQFPKTLAEADIVKTLENGKNKMPSFKGKLTPDEIAQVAKFVKSLEK